MDAVEQYSRTTNTVMIELILGVRHVQGICIAGTNTLDALSDNEAVRW